MFEPDENSGEELEVGMTLANRFRLIAKVGKGGMGIVFQAIDLQRIGDPNDPEIRRVAIEEVPERAIVAIKVLPAEVSEDEAARKRLIEELDCSRELRHDQIIRMHDFYTDREWMFLSMECLQGHNLYTELSIPENREGLGLERTLQLLTPIADALHHAHQKGVIHNDLSSKNIFLLEGGGVKLIDFGIAQIIHQSITSSHGASREKLQQIASGTDPYMSPERLRGAKPDIRDDIYGFAVVFYECLTGQRPFSGGAIYQRPAEMEPMRPQPLTEGQWQGVLQVLQYDRDRRTDTVSQLIEVFSQQQQQPVSDEEEIGQSPAELRQNLSSSLSTEKTRSYTPLFLASGIAFFMGVGVMLVPDEEIDTGGIRDHVVTKTEKTALTNDNPTPTQIESKGGSKSAIPSTPEGFQMVSLGRVGEMLEFTIGTPGEMGNEKPRDLRLKPFRIATYEVTNGMYRAYQKEYNKGEPGDHPVTEVNWNEAEAYIAWLNRQLNPEKKYRLPTEAEWEYAARGDTKTKYWWGDDPPVCKKGARNGAKFYDKDKCNFTGTEAVGSYSANGYGLYDVHGNVWEWTSSEYTEKYNGSTELKRSDADRDSGLRVLRGGSWLYGPRLVRAANRNVWSLDYRNASLGFRLAQDL